ncbi:MAG: hypothetical protein ACREC0_04135 [Methylocella sp.]
MVAYANTAITIGSLKNALLYFDHIVPVNIYLEMLPGRILHKMIAPKSGLSGLSPLPDEPFGPDDLAPALLALRSFKQMITRKSWLSPLPDESLFGGLDDILPPSLRSNAGVDRLISVNVEMSRLINVRLKSGLSEKPTVFYQFVNDFRLGTLPLDIGGSVPTDKPEPESDTVISLASLDLIDGERASWEQIKEFRGDIEARDRLRRLRLFAYANYKGKSKDFVEDDILTKIADYEAAVKKWGFETAQGALNMLLTSKVIGGALAGSLVSTLFGVPTIAAVAAASGGALEIGRITLEITKQRLALRNLMSENPVSFISYAREKLQEDTSQT